MAYHSCLAGCLSVTHACNKADHIPDVSHYCMIIEFSSAMIITLTAYVWFRQLLYTSCKSAADDTSRLKNVLLFNFKRFSATLETGMMRDLNHF